MVTTALLLASPCCAFALTPQASSPSLNALLSMGLYLRVLEGTSSSHSTPDPLEYLACVAVFANVIVDKRGGTGKPYQTMSLEG